MIAPKYDTREETDRKPFYKTIVLSFYGLPVFISPRREMCGE